MKTEIGLTDTADRLKAARKVLIVSHAHPDGDTLGSARALQLVLEKLGKKAVCICEDEIPESLALIFDGSRLYTVGEYISECSGFCPDTTVCVDTASKELMGKRTCELLHGAADIKIDHHGSGDNYAEIVLKDALSASCAEIVYRLCKLLCTPDAEICKAVYIGMITDTGCFRYQNTTAETLQTAAEIKSVGIDTSKLNSEIFENRGKKELSAIRLALNEVKYYLGGEVCSVFVSRKLKSEYDINDEQMHVISAFIKEISGVELSVVIRQTDEDGNKYKISARSKEKTDVSRMCAAFQGGGHMRAAGGSYVCDDPLKAEHEIMEKILAYYETLK